MPRRCSYPRCSSGSAFFSKKKNPAIRLFKVPREDQDFVAKTFQVVNTGVMYLSLCSLHFRKDAFNPESSHRPELRTDIVFRDFLILPAEAVEPPPPKVTEDEKKLGKLAIDETDKTLDAFELRQQYEAAIQRIKQLEADLELSRSEVQNLSRRDDSSPSESPLDVDEDEERGLEVIYTQLAKLQAKKVQKNDMLREELMLEIASHHKELAGISDEKALVQTAIDGLQSKIDAHKRKMTDLGDRLDQVNEELDYFQSVLKEKEVAWKMDSQHRDMIAKLIKDTSSIESPTTGQPSPSIYLYKRKRQPEDTFEPAKKPALTTD